MSQNPFDDQQNSFGDKPNPFAEQPNQFAAPANPYQSPTAGSGYGQDGSNPLLVPAVILIILASLTLLMILVSTPIQLMQMGEIDLDTPEGMGELTGMIVALVGWSITNIAIIIGSVGMLRYKGYSGAITATIISMIPICSPCYVLGIPFGIWALVVLLRPEVKARFQ